MTDYRGGTPLAKEMERLKKKSWWRRCNRGFVVSMALLAAVIIYVLVTQLMLIPVQESLEEKADAVRDVLMDTYDYASSQQASALTMEGRQQWQEEVAAQLEPLFDENSDYLESSALTVMGPAMEGLQRKTQVNGRELLKRERSAYMVDEDVASITMLYTYRISGHLYNPYSGEYVDVDDARQSVSLTLSLKKIDEEWKIYRICDLGELPLRDAEGGIIR